MTNVQQLTSSVWDLVQDEYVDQSVNRYEYRSYEAQGNLLDGAGTANLSSALTIRITNTEDFLLMKDAYLYLKLKIIKADNTNYVIAHRNTLAANAQAIFSNLQLRCGGSIVHQIQNPGHASLVRNLMTMSKDYADSLSLAEWFLPEYANIKTGDLNDISANPHVATVRSGAAQTIEFRSDAVSGSEVLTNRLASFNQSYRKRFAMSNTSKEFEIAIPLVRMFPFLDSMQSVTRGLIYEIVGTIQNDFNQVLHAAVGVPDGKLLITQARCYVPSLTPSVSTLSYVEAQLASNAVNKIIYENFETHFSSEYAYTTTAPKFRDIKTSKRPLYCFVGFQSGLQITQQADDGIIETDQDKCANPLQYISHGGEGLSNVTSVVLFVNSQRFPLEDIVCDFPNDQYVRAHNEFLRVCGKIPFSPEDSSIVDYITFKYQYPLFAFDLRKLPSSFGGSEMSYSIDINAQVTAGTQGTYRMAVTLVTEESLLMGFSGGRQFIQV